MKDLLFSLDYTCNVYSNLQHLKVMFEGYRARMINHPYIPECEYLPGSANELSFQMGVKLATKDIVDIL